jgi:predicted nucleotidyltransferase
LIETAKQALAKGELKIAENYLINAIRTVMLDNSYKRSPEPYRYLAEVLERKAEDENLELPQRQHFLLQAAALYNFVRNFLKTEEVKVELSKIQAIMVEMVDRNPLHCKFDSERKQNDLKNLRNKIKQWLADIECRRSSKNQESLNKCDVRPMRKDEVEEIKKLSGEISVGMRQFLEAIINECLGLLGTPPCDYEVIVFGSLARNEMTPYSDFEWAILTNLEEEECKVFFRNLTNLVHLQVGKLSLVQTSKFSLTSFICSCVRQRKTCSCIRPPMKS